MDHLNVIIKNNHLHERDREILFPEEEKVFFFSETSKDMFDLLVMIGAFKSKSQARKNWNETGKDIPPGWSEFTIGKLKRQLCIWNPKISRGLKDE